MSMKNKVNAATAGRLTGQEITGLQRGVIAQ
jgi:hypothetical protein